MSGEAPTSREAREAKLAQALRANLRRRKSADPPAAAPPKPQPEDNRS